MNIDKTALFKACRAYLNTALGAVLPLPRNGYVQDEVSYLAELNRDVIDLADPKIPNADDINWEAPVDALEESLNNTKLYSDPVIKEAAKNDLKALKSLLSQAAPHV